MPISDPRRYLLTGKHITISSYKFNQASHAINSVVKEKEKIIRKKSPTFKL